MEGEQSYPWASMQVQVDALSEYQNHNEEREFVQIPPLCGEVRTVDKVADKYGGEQCREMDS